MRLIDDRLSRESTLLVVAPSGYGKTAAVSEWASTHPGRVAWLTLGPFATNPARVGVEALRALQELAIGGAADLRPLLEIDPDAIDPAELPELLRNAVDAADSPVYLVVDDAHRAQDRIREGLIGALMEQDDDRLGLVLAGTSHLELSLSRLALGRPQVVVRAQELAFDLAEVRASIDRLGLDVDPEAVFAETQGWPIAVRLVQLAGVHPDETLMRKYVSDHLLSSVPEDLAQFALTTSVCDALTPELAAAVTGREDSAELLERCVRLGLFIDRYDVPDGSLFRWHSVFARQCRAILVAEDPDRHRAACAAAAASVEHRDPIGAAHYLRRAGDTAGAVRMMMAHWLELFIGERVHALNEWCASLPSPFDDDPRVLLIKACAQDLIGARDVAQIAFARADARAELLDDRAEYDSVRAIAALQLTDDRDELADATARVHIDLAAEPGAAGRSRAAATYLLGFAELRHRRAPDRAVQLLTCAAVEADAVGDRRIADRARGQLAFAHAWTGDLRRARSVLAKHTGTADDEAWTAYAGAVAGVATTKGSLAYWGGDFDAGMTEFAKAIREGSAPISFSGVARMMMAYTAAASRDSQACQRAARELQAIPQRMIQGVDWSVFRHTAVAALHEAAGNRAQALKIVDRYARAEDLPLAMVLLSGIAVRAGNFPLASGMLARQERYMGISYVSAARLSVDAQLHWQRGKEQQAHDLVEQALDVAAPEEIRRVFSGAGVPMRQLLAEHLAWGTRHESFTSECLAPRRASGPFDSLSEREGAVFSQLRTTKTMQEIADALGVSINTVKTHQRSIYRKLGVANRRDAVRRFS
ncbi:LuxR C-terminal-related transcriptional regulator [Microbacterium halophytorum]|uniref:LuxR C-terminal-related transcriptional regulator n=1 Tax=Microbacterium halophytorum TaxID=2067568 RepID=UPI001319E860|nr:LuxR C-terminal-related transcriptional regulator [Microbacterium halophytorum]